MKCLLLVSDINLGRHVLTDFHKKPKHEILWELIPLESHRSLRAVGERRLQGQ